MSDIVKRLWTALQPIVDLETGQVVAHEALLRGPQGTQWESPAALFHAANRLGHRDVLEATARKLALDRLKDLPAHQKLFINVDAWSPDIPAMPGRPDIPPERVVLELSERQPILDNPALLDQVRHWRANGHSIALDDYGAGYMGVGALLMLEPDLIKLDHIMIADIDRDRKRQAIVQGLARLSGPLQATIIAEGLETPEEIACVRALGIRFGQGYALGRPQRDPAASPIMVPIRETAPCGNEGA